ncbi:MULTISPECIES: MFS transporter [Pseudofrankia]|uniref:MFS transporter n=1 Tax=Pseudofrankia TaxID=2994363 RepID=UPI000234CE2E|nr:MULTISPECIES: MFS transporter [Pseudofrankia]OHV28166.1 MFS transporter [Pseudofrankia sp. EUN1h]
MTSSIDVGKPSLAARLDRLPVGRIHLVAVICVGLGFFFDTYEVFLAGTLSVVLKERFGFGGDALKLLLASAFVGQFAGALVLGRLADRIGRRNSFLLNLLIYSVFSLVGGLAPNVEVLVGARFLAGMGLGAELTLGDSYLSDLLPPRVRGRLIAVAYTIGFLGVPAAGFLGRGLVARSPVGVDGWRWMFFLGALGAVLVWALRRVLPESPRWLESVGRHEEADRIVTAWETDAVRRGHALSEPVPVPAPTAPPETALRRPPFRVLFTGPFLRRTVMAWIMNVMSAIGYYGFGTIATLVLVAKGYTVLTSLSFLALTYVGYPLGSLLSLPVIERFERRAVVAVSASGMAVTGLLFGFAGSGTTVVLWGTLFTLISNVYSNGYHVFTAELYPTAVRATAVGAAYALSRLVTAALPFVLIPVLDHAGSGAVFTVVAAALVILALDVLALGPRTTGLPVDQAAALPQRRPAPAPTARELTPALELDQPGGPRHA